MAVLTNNNKTINRTTLALAVATALSSVAMPAFADENPDDDKPAEYYERIQILGNDNRLRTEPGSTTVIGEAELEKFKFNDINRVLYSVPGVNIREEDGFGLRPNIGFRGATPERSQKITVMEDGILIGPAPYSAPAAYYFPMMSKITSVEVSKGPAATKYGPNTVAGAINLVTRQVPQAKEGSIDLAAGSDGFGRAKAYFGSTNGDFGYVVEGVHLRSDGFKELDGGGDTGFEKNDIMAKFNYDLSGGGYSQIVELKLAYADEESNETYLGLTDADFAENPNRRYAADQLALMDWEHKQFMFTHFIGNDTFDVTTRIYHNDFDRSWFKLNSFKGGLVNRDLQEILANPEDEVNARFYRILTGEQDSVQEFEKLLVGDNYREFYSQGIQSELYYNVELAGLKHQVNAGFRFHKDQIRRRHTEDAFFMRSGNLVSDGSPQVATTSNRETSEALAVFLKDTIYVNDFEFTLGIRGEFIDSEYQNEAPGSEGDYLNKDSRIWLPSASVFYKYSDELGFFAGVHEGFVPTRPQESPEVDIENSVNYEVGTRYHNGNSQLEAVVFFNDFDSLKESCSFSAASACGGNLDAEFNSGEASVLGLELAASHTFATDWGIDVPTSITYTYIDGEFDTSFVSDFPMWGAVEEGDALPYLPENQLSVSLGLASNDWEVSLVARYIDEMLEASGDGVVLSGVTTESLTVVDMSASYDFGDYGSVYLKLDNVFDKQEIVSRRPFGARPTKPQQAIVGYQYSF
ncbi:TonB-dependent receptor family protein [Thalassotalea euphylliae]|uniref:TonB-dependent receptor n=1 Tax=Thalassotalea euphylliae TaxID=1655234 RepID=A0A3E0UJ51_9GAMM|nr:TonB-dependent receptor [Thalassotalea euphylliae]REL36971.1 TonB-dependent receptor [Thalassotalea euphylliae]